ncbi:hypothetical protein P692DRAFT_20684138, partial [Suillus brevipes Sb2]
TDSKLGVLWIQHLDEHTRDKANGSARFLLVDGHSFYYIRVFLEYKARWQRESGEELSKQIFLAIYGYAHNRALTTELIKAAFEKTGVHPFNSDVVTEDVMAPSQETSCRGHLPLIQTTPVCLMSELI